LLAGEHLRADEDNLETHTFAIQQQFMNRIPAIAKPGNDDGHDRALVGADSSMAPKSATIFSPSALSIFSPPSSKMTGSKTPT
jgi:hypothetical protein